MMKTLLFVSSLLIMMSCISSLLSVTETFNKVSIISEQQSNGI